jgi:hypothetical protein
VPQRGFTKALQNKAIPEAWERTGLVARTVFKIAEVVARRLVGSIPTRSRHLLDSALFLRGFAGRRCFHYTVYYKEARAYREALAFAETDETAHAPAPGVMATAGVA